MSSAIEEISLPPSELSAQDAGAAGNARVGVTETADMPPDDDAVQTRGGGGGGGDTSEEEKTERRVLIRKLMRYRALFQSEVEDIDLSDLGARPLEELRDLARDVEFLVSTRRSAKAVRGMFIGGVQLLETGGPFLGLNLQGLTSVVAQSKDLLETVDEAAVRYERIMDVDPVARIAIQMGQLVLAIDSHNRQKKVSAPPLTPSQPVVVAVTPPQQQAEPLATVSTPIIKRKEYDDL